MSWLCLFCGRRTRTNPCHLCGTSTPKDARVVAAIGPLDQRAAKLEPDDESREEKEFRRTLLYALQRRDRARAEFTRSRRIYKGGHL